jgi:hypothetical protein
MNQQEKSEAQHSDTLARFLRLATDQPLSSPAWALAAALGKTFYPSDVAVRWRISRDLPGSRRGRRRQKDSKLTRRHLSKAPVWECCEAQWSAEERQSREGVSLKEALEWTEATVVGAFELSHVRPDSAQLHGFRIGRKSPIGDDRAHLEVIFLETVEPFQGEKIDNFRRNIVGITTLFQAFAALQAARLALPRRAAAKDFVAYIDECRNALLSFSVFPGVLALQERIVEDLTLEMFGLGWDVHNLAGPRGVQALKDLVDCLTELSQKSPKLRLLQAILAASLGAPPHGVRKDARESPREFAILDLIARWSYLHTRSREVLRLGAAHGDWKERESEYLETARDCRSPLAKLICDQIPAGKPMEGVILPSWLRLWFCQIVLEEISSTESGLLAASSATRWRFFADLAYVIRENLRGMIYGSRPEFKFQPVVFANALCTLVEQHALRALELPQGLDLGGLLREIGRLSLGGGPYFASGHLQHVLEMYIAGLFISNTVLVNVNRPEGLPLVFEGATVREVLAGAGAWRPGQAKQQEFRKAFGLAVLLHDIGMLLFPHWPRRAEDLAELGPGLRKNFRGIRDVLNGSVQQLFATCERELIEAGIYDPAKEPRIKAWIEDCIERGEADHSVLGAWYLLRIARNVSGLSIETLRQAVRAVLLHAIATYEIRTEEDPVAALLVFCDELVVWREVYEPPEANEVGRYFYSIAGEVRPEDSIYRTLRIPGLDISLEEESGYLSCSLDLGQNLEKGDHPCWPQVEIELKSPDQLPVPVYHLWLAAGQNLGRIESAQTHWGPVLAMRSQIPDRQPPMGTRELLGRVVQRAGFKLRPCLQRWLYLYQVDRDEGFGFESVMLGPSDSFFSGSLKLLFPELDGLVKTILHEEDLRQQEPLSRSRPGTPKSKRRLRPG